MSSSRKSTGQLFNFRTKFLAVAMAVILAFSMFDLSAFAEMSEEENSTLAGSAEEQDSSILLDLRDAYLEVKGQTVTGTTLVVPAGTDLSFTARPNSGFMVSEVKASNATLGEVPLVKQGELYTISNAHIDSSLKVVVITEADVVIPEEPSDTGSLEDDSITDESASETLNEAADEEKPVANTQAADEVTPLNDGETQDSTVIASSGEKSLLVTPMESIVGGVITKLSGDSLDTLFSLSSSDLDGVIVAIPRDPHVDIKLTSSPPVDGVVGSYVSRVALESNAGVVLNPNYDEYFVFASNREGSSGSSLQFIDVSFTFKEGTTPAHVSQPIEGYVIDGVIDSTNAVVPGSTVAISANATSVKAPEGTSPHMVSDAEELSIEKSVKLISGGADGSSTTLDTRPFNDPENYTVEYTLSVKSDRAENATGNQGRLKIKDNFVVHDELTNLLVGRDASNNRIGQPTQITIKGNGVNKTISSTEINAFVGDSLANFPFEFNAKLTNEGYVEETNYTVVVTYDKDHYTDFFETSEKEIESRQKITNSAWVKAETQAGTLIDTSQAKSAADNYIGYKQSAPGGIQLDIQKVVSIKSVESPYNKAMQLRYPEVLDDPTKVVTFTLTPKPADGSDPLLGSIDSNGKATIVGLVPNTTYELTESQSIASFDPLDPVEVKVGASVGGVAPIKIGSEDKDYYGQTYAAVNQAIYDGTITVNVKLQENDLSSADIGDYEDAQKDEIELSLYVRVVDAGGEETLVPVSTVSTDENGKVVFENLDSTLEYVVKANTDLSSKSLKANEDTIAFGPNEKDKTATIKYTSTYGGLKIGKKFVGADGQVVNTGLTANFTLTNQNPLALPQKYNLAVGAGTSASAVLYKLAIAPGTYTLSETSITGEVSGEYTKAADQTVVITAGKFDSFNTVLTNESTYGQLKIVNFDFGNNELAKGLFTYNVTGIKNAGTPDESTVTYEVTLAEGESSKIISVPSGYEYTLTQTSQPDAFVPIKTSDPVTVAVQLAPSGAMSVGGSAPNFTFSGATQTLGIVNGILPEVVGSKVSVQGKEKEGTTVYQGLEDAVFALYKLDGASYKHQGTVKSGEDGALSIEGLLEGEYRLVEITPPLKYVLSTDAQTLNAAAIAGSDFTVSDLQNMPSISISLAHDYAAYGANESVKDAQKTVSINSTDVTNALSDKSMIPNSPVVTPEIKMVSAEGDGKGGIKGGLFNIQRVNSDGTYTDLGTALTTKTGSVEFVDGDPVQLGEGSYRIIQESLSDEAADYVARPGEVVTLTVNSKGEATSSFSGDEKYANSHAEGEKITFSNAKKPSIVINKLGETNVFEAGKRVEKPLSGAVFVFYNKTSGLGLVIDEDNNKFIGEGLAATEQTTYRGSTQVHLLDPDPTQVYTVAEISAPDIEGTELGRQIEENIPDVLFEYAKKDGEIVGYQIVGQSAEGSTPNVWIKGNTLTVHDPAEDTYQIQVSKYGLGTNNGNLSLDDANAQGVYVDGVNAKFLIQKQVTVEEGGVSVDKWITVETITTGTHSVDNAELNKALSSELTKGTYRIVEIQSGIYSPEVGSGNKLYEYTGTLPIATGGAVDISTGWEEIVTTPTKVDEVDGEEVYGLVWPGEITLGPDANADHSDPDNPYNATIGNDDERSTGAPWYGDYVVRLHGLKLSIDQDVDPLDPTAVQESTTGEVGKVEFEVSFGWAKENSAGEYELIDSEALTPLSHVVSGSVVGEKGGFITEYVTFKAWDGNSSTPGYEEETGPGGGAVPCFVLVELGPVPDHLVQPTDETRTVLLPFNIPSLGSNDDGGYYTINSADILPQGSNGMGDYQVSNGTVIKNYEAEGALQINKYSSTDLNVDKKDRTPIHEGLYRVYPVIETDNGNGTTTETVSLIPAATIDLASGNNEVELFAGKYVVEEITAPEGYNKSGWYRFNGGNKTEFAGMTKYLEVPESDEPVVLNIFNAPYATLQIENYWDTAKKDGESATYSVSYNAPASAAGLAFASYPHTTKDGANEPSPLNITVTGKNTTTLHNLPDGEYLIKEAGVGNGDTYNSNVRASENGIKVVIKNGRVAKTGTNNTQGGLQVSEDNLTWRAINGFDQANTTNATKDNVDRADTEVPDGEDEDDKIKVTTVKVNHLSKSRLGISMRHINSVGVMENNAGGITKTKFTVKTFDGLTTVAGPFEWTSDTKYVPLSEGVYQVQQDTEVTSSDGLSYTADTLVAYVYISTTGQVTYLQNNNAGKDANNNAIGVDSTDTKAGALQPGAQSSVKYFYNKVNAGKLVIIKTDSTTGAPVKNAGFTVAGSGYSQVATKNNAAPGTTGVVTHYIISVPAAQNGGTSYGITETTTPPGYYVDTSTVPVVVRPNQVTEVFIKNVPFTSLSVHKTAQTTSYIDENGNLQSGTTHDVYGLDVKIYQEGSSTAYASGSTDRAGNLTFSGLDAGTYRIEEQTNLPYLDVARNTQYNSSNTLGHFTVTYEENADSDAREVSITPSSGVEVQTDSATGHISVQILNHYKDGSIFIPVKKVDADTGDPVEGAEFRLVDEEGNALYEATNRAVVTVVTNDKGIAYFHFMPEDIYTSTTGSDPYKKTYYVKEIDATDEYVISPYESEYLKEATSKTNAEGDVSYDTIIFKNEAKQTAPSLGVSKAVVADPQAPLTQLENGFEAVYAVTPAVTYQKGSDGEFLGNQLINYAVTDKGFVFNDSTGAKIVDSRLTYTVKSLAISGAASGDENKTLYASVDGGSTWTPIVDGKASFTLNRAGAATNPATSLFDVWYSEKNADGSYERIVSKGFKPGVIAMTVGFDQFVMESNPATLSNEVAKIINTVETTADYPSSDEDTGLVSLTSAKASATIEMPEMPTLIINKELVSATGDVRRGKTITYKVTLTNNSSKTIKNPTIIDRPQLVSFGGSEDEVMRVVLEENNKPRLNSVNGGTTSSAQYQSFAWNNGAVAAWVFAEDLAAGDSISIEFDVKINSVVSADAVTNIAYGTSLVDYDDVSVAPTYYAKDNPTGAIFKAQTKPTAAGVATEAEVAALMGITQSQLNGGVFVKSVKTNTLESTQGLTVMKDIKNSTTASWSSYTDVLPGESYDYRLQVQWLADGTGKNVKDIVVNETIPQVGTLGTAWNNDLISRLTFENLAVFGYDSTGTYRELLENSDFKITYDTGNATSFNSFSLEMLNGYELKPKQALTITYTVNVPEVEDTGFTYEMLENNARKDGNSRFVAKFSYSGQAQNPANSNMVTAHLLAPETDLVGTVWDDQNRNGELEDPELSPAYTRDTLVEDDVTVVLHKQTFDNQGVGTWEEHATTSLNADGTYEFTGLESSYGTNGPNYRVEFIYNQGSDTYERPRTHVFSEGSATTFVNGGSTAGVSNVVNKNTNNTKTALVGDSGIIRLLHGVVGSLNADNQANVVNAGINAIPYKASYNYGTAPAGASALPGEEVYIYEDEVSVQPDATAPGYDFIGWNTQNVNGFTEDTAGYKMPPNNVELTGIWVARGDTPYIVEYYFQNIGGKGYTKNDSETRNYRGETDTLMNAPVLRFTGFTHNPSAPGTLLSDNLRGDGSTVLKVYYDRNQYTVSYVYTGAVPQGAPGLPSSTTYWFGDTVTVAHEPSLAGYTFNGWSHSGTFPMPARDVTISGTWVAKGDTPYRVEYYLQNIGGGGYTIDKSSTYYGSGRTDTTVHALIKSYDGFTHNAYAPGSLLTSNLKGDGSTVLRVYYDRNQYVVNYVYTGTIPVNAPMPPAAAMYWFGQTVNVAAIPQLEGYTFYGWSETGSFSMPARNLVIRGAWAQNGSPTIPIPSTTPTIVPGGFGGEGSMDTITSTVAPITDALKDLSGILETTIDDTDTPLAGVNGAWCWVHWYILLGILITAVYSLAVVIRRRRFTSALNDLEKEVMGEEEVNDTVGYGTSTPTGRGA